MRQRHSSDYPGASAAAGTRLAAAPTGFAQLPLRPAVALGAHYFEEQLEQLLLQLAEEHTRCTLIVVVGVALSRYHTRCYSSYFPLVHHHSHSNARMAAAAATSQSIHYQGVDHASSEHTHTHAHSADQRSVQSTPKLRVHNPLTHSYTHTTKKFKHLVTAYEYLIRIYIYINTHTHTHTHTHTRFRFLTHTHSVLQDTRFSASLLSVRPHLK